MEEPAAAAAMAAVLTDDVLLPSILKRLSPVHLLRAALACHRWHRAAALAIPRAPPLLGCFVHPGKTRSPPPMARADIPAVFVPSDACSPHLSLAMVPDDSPDLAIRDVHFGLVLLLPDERPEMLLRRIVVLDPASRRRALLPPPPREALPDDKWHQSRLIIGAAVLSRAHPSKLVFEAVCVTLDEDRPRAWVASVQDDDCIWRALPRSKQAKDQLDSFSSEKRCVHSKGKIYWPICNSRRVLALDARTLEFSFVVAPVDLGRHFDNYGIGKKAEDARCIVLAEEETELGMNQPVFPYYLCWPPEFLATLKGDAWTENMMELVQIAVYNISYIRKLFPEEYFNETSLLPSGILGVKIRNLIPLDEESERLADWITKGVYDALQKRFLRRIMFGLYEEGGLLIEEYSLSFSYGDDIAMDIGLTGHSESIWTLTSNAAESLSTQLWCSASTLVEKLVLVLSSRDQIPAERAIMIKLMYYDQVTPPDYEPPFFKSFDDMRRVNPQRVHTTLNDMPQDSDSSEIAMGYFYCITEKKVTFYFDSAASRHMSGEKTLIENLRKVGKENWVSIHTANNESVCLDHAGHIKFGGITLGPVYLMEGLPYNIISLGQLDDGKNLIYLGENRINIFNTETCSVIGEGILHRNKGYVVSNITSLNEPIPGKKKTRAILAGGAESEVGKKILLLKEPPTDIEKKSIWTLDCFCEQHMTGNRDLLCNTRSVNKVFATPKGEFEATEIGDVITDAVVLHGVLYCPGISANIISEVQLDGDGYSCTRFAHRCKIQYRKTKEVVGIADEDKEFIYRVNYFHPFGTNSKHLREDESVGPSSKFSRKDKRLREDESVGPSLKFSRKDKAPSSA